MSTLVILPTFNEAENVLPLSSEVLAESRSIEVLVVDDHGSDGTAELVREAMRSEPRLHLIEREGKLGLGSAYLAGFRFGIDRDFECIATMDCDFSHKPKDLPRLLAASDSADLVIGSRYVEGGGIANWPARRRALSAFANLYARTLLRLPVRDCTSGYRCMRREVFGRIDPFAVRVSGYSFLEEIVWRVHHAGLRIAEVPIVFDDRRRGVSKIDRGEILTAARHVFAMAWRRPSV